MIKRTQKVTDMKKEDKQKPAQQKQEASKKTEEQAVTPVQEQGEGNPHKQYNIRWNQLFHKGNHFLNFSDKK